VQALDGGMTVPISAPDLDLRFPLVSGDGRVIDSADSEGRLVLQPADGGAPRVVDGLEPGDWPLQWSSDGKAGYGCKPDAVPIRVFRVDLASGARQLWKEVDIPDRTALWRRCTIVVTPDARAYAYSFTRSLGELFLVEGLK